MLTIAAQRQTGDGDGFNLNEEGAAKANAVGLEGLHAANVTNSSRLVALFTPSLVESPKRASLPCLTQAFFTTVPGLRSLSANQARSGGPGGLPPAQ